MSGLYIQTFTGKKFYWDRIEDNEYDIVDIAHALSMNCRFTGHTRRFYSVAEHCLMVSSMVPESLSLAGLLHDAAEAYVHDIPTPLKQWLREHGHLVGDNLEKSIQSEIYLRFQCKPFPEEEVEIKMVDKRMGATEARDLMTGWPWPEWGPERGYVPYENIDLTSEWLYDDIKTKYLKRFWSLGAGVV